MKLISGLVTKLLIYISVTITLLGQSYDDQIGTKISKRPTAQRKGLRDLVFK